MPYVITSPCIDEMDMSCVEVCPVDCIYEGERMLYIHPDECIECGRCEPACPHISIFHHEDLPPESAQFEQVNAEFFTDAVTGLGSPGGARKVGAAGTDHPYVADYPAKK